MTETPFDAAAFVAGAWSRGTADLRGLRLDVDPKAEALLLSCSGHNPAREVVYAHEFTPLDRPLHRLFVCDARNGWYLGGVAGLTGSIHATIGLLGQVIAELRPARSIAIGTSMGGYLSLLLGCAGLVDEAIAFSPQTTLDPDWRRAHADHRWGWEIDDGIAALAPLPPPDPAAWAAAPLGRAARLHLIYPAAEAPDVAHAERLADCANALLYPVDTCHHVVSQFLRRHGVLSDVIGTIIAGGAPHALIASLHDDPDDPERAYRDGVALLERTAFAEAERAFRRAAAAERALPHYVAGLAEAIWRQGRRDEALAVGRAAVAAAPQDPYRRLSLAQLAKRAGLLPEAEANLRDALALAPQDRRFAEELCGFLVSQGRAAEAGLAARAALGQVRDAPRFRERIDTLLGPEWQAPG